MKTLHAFWHWFENEKPAPRDADEQAETNLSRVAFEAFTHACEHVCIRAHYDHSTLAENREWALEYEPVATRKLSVSLCRALEEMHAEVPEESFSGAFLDTLYGVARGVDRSGPLKYFDWSREWSDAKAMLDDKPPPVASFSDGIRAACALAQRDLGRGALVNGDITGSTGFAPPRRFVEDIAEDGIKTRIYAPDDDMADRWNDKTWKGQFFHTSGPNGERREYEFVAMPSGERADDGAFCYTWQRVPLAAFQS